MKLDLVINLNQFQATIWGKHNTQHGNQTSMMGIYDYVSKDANVKIMKKTTGNIIKSNKCNQCEFAFAQVGDLRRHLKMHSGEKSNKCNQCDFASSYSSALRAHLKTHSGEKPNKCNVTMHPLRQAI